ncbi:MAG: hypothetical protein V4793_05405 [Paraburkholderia tropica]
MTEPRIVCQFSCGAASAVATKLILARYGDTRDVQIVNAFIKEEHEDNRRFLADCQEWFGRQITVLRDEKYGASATEVFRRKRYLRGLRGAPCSKALKRDLLDAFRHPTDVVVLGFTVDEQDRYDDFLDHHPQISVLVPLIERGLTKADCLGALDRAGIEMPMMYRLGYDNANCIGCVKGGMGYWNKVRRDFPERFEEIATIEESIGPSAYLFRDRAANERFSLRQLPPDAGRHDEPMPSCSFFCEIAVQEFTDA